jgi:hypothetical protein
MSAYIDKMFINMVSDNLKRFKWKKDNLANCRCPFCGDSKKRKNIARGYFYQKGNDFFFRCHNCGYGTNLYNFLDNMNPNLAKEYALRRFTCGENGRSNYKKPKNEELFTPSKKVAIFEKPINSVNVCDLSPDDKVVQYLESRKIPDESLCYFYYTEDFSQLAKSFDPEHNLKPEPRLVIPFYNDSKELIGVQGRALEADSKIRYITLKKDSVEKLWYGLWRVNPEEPIYITEGPIDSIFLPNSLAMVGAAGDMKLPEKIAKSEVIYVFDNEKRNKQICAFMETVIEKGHKILIWPDVKVKDINDYVLAFGDPMAMIRSNTHSGLEAKLRFMKWKK